MSEHGRIVDTVMAGLVERVAFSLHERLSMRENRAAQEINAVFGATLIERATGKDHVTPRWVVRVVKRLKAERDERERAACLN